MILGLKYGIEWISITFQFNMIYYIFEDIELRNGSQS